MMKYMQKKVVASASALVLSMTLTVNAFADTAVSTVSGSAVGWSTNEVAENVATPSTADLEAKLRLVKSRINIPDSYENFEYYQNSNGGNSISYEFSWNNGLTGTDWGYINVSITDNFITRYWFSQNRENSYSAHFGKLSKEKARSMADSWIKKVNPAQYPNIRIVEEQTYSDLQMQTISFSLQYVKDEIPVNGMSGNIIVSTQTGEISNYYMDWQEISSYPDKSKAIGSEQAKEQFEKNIGLKPVYKVYSDGYGKTTSFIAYVQKNASKVINAMTGEAENSVNYYRYKSIGQNSTAEAAMDSGGGSSSVRLTPAEIEKMEQAAGLISVAEAEKLARSNKYTEITKDMNLVSSSLDENRYEKGRYQWYLSFAGTPSDGVGGDVSIERQKLMIAAGEANSYVNVTLDATTGDFIGLNRYSYSPLPRAISISISTDQVSKYDKHKDFAQAAFNSLLGKKAAEYKLQDNNGADSSDYTFARYVNGIEFPDNSFSMNVDEEGKITNLYGAYYNIDFAKPVGLISEDAALDAAFASVPYTMIYDFERNYTDYSSNPEVLARLLYVWENSGFSIHAVSGKSVDYRGKDVSISNNNYVGYDGLEDSEYKDEINKLGEHGIFIRNVSLSPDTAISQKDFLSLCANIFWGYYVDEEYIYERLIREGILKSSEKNPTAELTRDQMAKYTAAFMKIGEYSNLDGIFVKPYDDVTSNIGSIAILKALKVIDISGNNFEPGRAVTKTEALHYMYNYMNR